MSGVSKDILSGLKPRGRPQKNADEKLSEHVTVRLTKYERDAWGSEAERQGITLSNWIRDCVFLATVDAVEEQSDDA